MKNRADGLPIAFHTNILARVMDGSAMNDLYEQYQLGKLSAGRAVYVPSAKDLKIYKKWLNKEIGDNQAAEMMGVKSVGPVQRRFALIGAKLLQGEITL